MAADTKKTTKEKQERKLFKDWFDKAAANAMATQISAVYGDFDKTAFKRHALRKIETLEFNDRVKQFSNALHKTLPEPYPEAIKIVSKSLPEVPVSAESVTDGWLQWPIGQFIADYGTNHLKESLPAMIELTQRFSSEFAVRPFVQLYPQEVFSELLKLTGHSSEHVRRWCSEGTRTRLPWGIKLQDLIDNPQPILPILNALIDDQSLYVRRSVANSLNDLSKDHPELVIKHCSQWKKKNHPDRDWIIKHGLRGLIKAGNSEALKLTGFAKPEKLQAVVSASPKKIKPGDSTQLQVTLENKSNKKQSLMVDYVVHYVRKLNVSNEKVFKWKTLDIAAGEKVSLTKKHPMKPTKIRVLYPGVHPVEVQVNGVRLAKTAFTLVE